MFGNQDTIFSIVVMIGASLAAIVVFWKNSLDVLLKLRELKNGKKDAEEKSLIHTPTPEEVTKYSKPPPRYKWQVIIVVKYLFVFVVAGVVLRAGLETNSMFDEKTANIDTPTQPETLPCRDPSHGVEKYLYTDTVRESSGKVGGGNNEAWWCQVMKNKYQATKPNTSIVWSNQSSSQQRDKDWKGHVTYIYHCTATASWDPVYKLKVSDACK